MNKLLRGKRIDNGEWVYGQMLIDDNSSAWIVTQVKRVPSSEELVLEKYQVDVGTIGESTGFIDGHGNKFFAEDYLDLFIMKFLC